MDSGRLGLRIVTLERAPDQIRVVQLHLEMMVFVGMFGGRGLEGELVVGAGVGHGLLQEGCDVVIGIEHLTAALGSQDLQTEVADIDLAGLLDALDEVLVVVFAHNPFAGAEGIDVVESGAGSAELVGEGHDVGEDLLLLLRSEVDAWTGEQGPARRDPKDDLAAGTGALTGHQRAERPQTEFGPILGAVDAGVTAKGFETYLVLVEGGTEGIAVGGCVLLNFGAGICDDGQGGGVREAAIVGAQELLDLGAGIGDGLVCGVDVVDDEHDLGWLLALRDSAEGGYRAGGVVVEKGEVLPLQVGNWSSPLGRDDHVESDLTQGRLSCGGGGLLGKGAGGGEQRAEKNEGKAAIDGHGSPFFSSERRLPFCVGEHQGA